MSVLKIDTMAADNVLFRQKVAALTRHDTAAAIEACAWIEAQASSARAYSSLVAAGVVPALVRLIGRHSDAESVLIAAGRALTVFAGHKGDPAEVAAIAAAGGVSLLLAILRAEHMGLQSIIAAGTLLNQVCWTAAGAAEIVSAGGIQTAEAALRRWMSSPHAVLVTSSLLGQLIASPAGADASFVDADGLRVLLEALHAHKGHEEAAWMVVTILGSVVQEAPGLAAALHAAGGWPTVASVLLHHASAVRVARAALLVMWCMADSAVISEPDRRSAMAAMVAALTAQPQDDSVVQSAIDILEKWMVLDDAEDDARHAFNVAAFAAAGGIAALVAAVRAQLLNPHLVEKGCLVLFYMASTESAAIIAAGALNVCLEALRNHLQKPDVVCWVVALASDLCQEPRPAASFVERGVLPLLRDAQRRHASHPLVVWAVWQMYNALADNQLIKSLDNVGGVTAVSNALDEGAGKPGVYVCNVLVHVGVDDAACGACIPALVAAWREQTADGAVVTAVSGVLASLGDVKANVEAMSAAGCLPLAVAGLGEHAQGRMAAKNMCTVLGTLLVALRQRDAFICSGAVPAMLSALRLHPHTRAVSEAVCASVSILVMHDADSCHGRSAELFCLRRHVDIVLPAVASGIVPATAAWLRCVPEIAAVGLCVCRPLALLNALAASEVGAAALAGEAPAIQLAIEAVDGSVPVCACGRLRALAAVCHLAASARIRAQMLAAGIVKPLLAQLDETKALPFSLQPLSLSVLVRLTADRAGCAALVQAGGMHVLQRHLSRISKEADIVDEKAARAGTVAVAQDGDAVADVLRALANAARWEEARAAMLDAELVSRACQFICIYNQANIVEAACAVVRAYAMGDGCERHIPVAECFVLTKTVLRGFAAHRGVMEQACAAVLNIVDSGDKVIKVQNGTDAIARKLRWELAWSTRCKLWWTRTTAGPQRGYLRVALSPSS